MFSLLLKQLIFLFLFIWTDSKSINITRGPLVLYRSPECWGYAELEQTWQYKSTQCSISCHPYRSIRNKFVSVINMVKVNPGSSFEKKPQGIGIQPLGTSSGSILKLLLFPSFCTSSRKIPFVSLYYMIHCILFYFIHVYKAPEQKETTLGDNCFMQAERSYHWSLGCMYQNNSSALWFYTHFIMIL